MKFTDIVGLSVLLIIGCKLLVIGYNIFCPYEIIEPVADGSTSAKILVECPGLNGSIAVDGSDKLNGVKYTLCDDNGDDVVYVEYPEDFIYWINDRKGWSAKLEGE